MSKGLQVKRSTSQKVSKSKGLQVKRSPSQKVYKSKGPQSKGPQSKGLQKSDVRDKSIYEGNTTIVVHTQVPVFFFLPSWHNKRYLLKFLHF